MQSEAAARRQYHASLAVSYSLSFKGLLFLPLPYILTPDFSSTTLKELAELNLNCKSLQYKLYPIFSAFQYPVMHGFTILFFFFFFAGSLT